MTDNVNQINGTDFMNTVDSANGSHTSNTNTSNITNTFNGFNTSANNNNQLLDRRTPFVLAIAEFVLGAVEFVWGDDESAKLLGEKAIHDGAESVCTIMKPGGRVEGMVEGQVQRVWALVVLLHEQAFWQWAWHRIRHYILRFWVLWARPWFLYVLTWLGFGGRVARE